MADDNNKRFQKIYNAAIKVYPQDSKANVQKRAVKLWDEVKIEERKDKTSSIFNETMAKLGKQAMHSKSKLQGFWSKEPKPPRKESVQLFTPTEINVVDDAIEVEDSQSAADSEQQQTAAGSSTADQRKNKKTHAQDELNMELGKINDELASYAVIKSTAGLSKEYQDRVDKLSTEKIEVEKRIKRKLQDVESQRKSREKKKKEEERKKKVLETLQQNHPEVKILYYK